MRLPIYICMCFSYLPSPSLCELVLSLLFFPPSEAPPTAGALFTAQWRKKRTCCL